VNKTVSIIGVGNMGGGMALNLLACGWRVQVHDIDLKKLAFFKEKGALALADAAQSATSSIVTIISVVDAAQVQDVLQGAGGLLHAAPAKLKRHTVLLCPTIAPQDVERCATALAQHGVRLIEAPMSGGPLRAQDGSMSLMVACEKALFEQHAGLLHDLSSRLFYVSARIGDGARTKLVNNLLAAINLAGAAEAMAMAERLGLDANRTLDVIEQSSGQSWIGSERMRRALAGRVSPPGAHMTLLAKDSRLALEAGRAAGSQHPLGEVAAGLFAQALQAGMSELDDAQMLDLLRGQLPES
jgi:L-threonate 2-dehydrogenase